MIDRAERPDSRHQADFPVYLSFQGPNGVLHRVSCRCVNLSRSGAKLETKDHLSVRSNILVHSRQFGRIGMASIRYCKRDGMKYNVGLQFASSFRLSDSERKKILEAVRGAQG